MSFLLLVYNEVFYRPLLNGLVFLTSALPFHDLGFAIILLTVLMKLATFPLTHSMLKTQKAMKTIEPEMKKIYAAKKNKEDQAKALMELYKSHGINPLSGFFALLLQFPLLLALFQVFQSDISANQNYLYQFLKNTQSANTVFLGLIELGSPHTAISFLAAASQFFQMKLATVPAPSSNAGDVQKTMIYVLPVVILIIGFSMPAAVSLYWTAMNVFAIIHEAVVRRKATNAEPVS